MTALFRLRFFSDHDNMKCRCCKLTASGPVLSLASQSEYRLGRGVKSMLPLLSSFESTPSPRLPLTRIFTCIYLASRTGLCA